MGAPDSLLYEYAVIRYVPRVHREEFVNIGLIMLSKRNGWMKSLVLIDEPRILSLYPGADIESLKRQSRLFEMNTVPASDLPIEEKYRWLTAAKSACLQVSPSHPGMVHLTTKNSPSENSHSAASLSSIQLMEAEFTRLFTSLVL